MLAELGEAATEIPDDAWTPPEASAEVVSFIATGALDALSGRHIDASEGDWTGLAASADEIVRDDSRVLRLRR
jgi:hypothetical protein